MESADVLQIALASLASGGGAGAVAWAVIRVELKYLRRDVDKAHERITHHQRDFHHGQT